MGIPPPHHRHTYHTNMPTYVQTYIDSNVQHTHAKENEGEKRNYGGRLMERVAKMRPWERKVENERERGLLRGAKERCSVLWVFKFTHNS